MNGFVFVSYHFVVYDYRKDVFKEMSIVELSIVSRVCKSWRKYAKKYIGNVAAEIIAVSKER
jgi:hypothetical protein